MLRCRSNPTDIVTSRNIVSTNRAFVSLDPQKILSNILDASHKEIETEEKRNFCLKSLVRKNVQFVLDILFVYLVVHSGYFPHCSWSDLHFTPDVLNCSKKQIKKSYFQINEYRYSVGEVRYIEGDLVRVCWLVSLALVWRVL